MDGEMLSKGLCQVVALAVALQALSRVVHMLSIPFGQGLGGDPNVDVGGGVALEFIQCPNRGCWWVGDGVPGMRWWEAAMRPPLEMRKGCDVLERWGAGRGRRRRGLM